MITHAQYISEGWCPSTHQTPHGTVWCFHPRGHAGNTHTALSLAPNAKAYRVHWEE